MSDASFADGAEQSLRLRALGAEDLEVISTLVQDAVFPMAEMKWSKNLRRFAILLNRFRWEDAQTAQQRGRAFERVQSVLAVEDVQNVQVQGLQQGDKDIILSLLSLSFEPSDDGAGRVLMHLSGDATIAIKVEALEVIMQDVTRPYMAPSQKRPAHEG